MDGLSWHQQRAAGLHRMPCDVLGYHVTCDDALCLDCFQKEFGDDDLGQEGSPGFEAWRKDGGFEDWAEPICIFRDAEADAPTHCRNCEALIPHRLTGHGVNYVAEHLDQALRDPAAGRRPILKAWADEYLEPDDLGAVLKEVIHGWPDRDEFSPPEG